MQVTEHFLEAVECFDREIVYLNIVANICTLYMHTDLYKICPELVFESNQARHHRADPGV